MPALAKVHLKVISWNMFGIWFSLGVIRCLGPKTNLRMINFLASPLKWERGASLAYSEAKYGE